MIALIQSLTSFPSAVQSKQLSKLLDEDPEVMERRAKLVQRLELYRSTQAEIDAVAWAK